MEQIDHSTNVSLHSSVTYYIDTFERTIYSIYRQSPILKIGDEVKLYRGNINREIFSFGILSLAIAFSLAGPISRITELSWKDIEGTVVKITKICVAGDKIIIQYQKDSSYLWTSDFKLL